MPSVHDSPGCLATRSIARRSTRSGQAETRCAPLRPGSPWCARAEGGRLGEGRAGARTQFAGRGGEGRTHESRSGGRREWLKSRKRASEGAALRRLRVGPGGKREAGGPRGAGVEPAGRAPRRALPG